MQEHEKNVNNIQTQKDFLWLHIKDLPYFRSLLRAVEARFFQDIDLQSPVLDIGCGDGHFASVTFTRKIEVGIDPWWDPLQEAYKLGGYQSLIAADGARIPFPDNYFASAISNSVLEHIPNVDYVLKEAWRVLKVNAPLIFCVPNDKLLSSLSIARGLEKFGLHAIANVYKNFFERIARHHHSDNPEIWQSRLSNAGFKLEQWWHYFSPSATAVMEWGHYFGLPSLIARKLTGKWILVPSYWNLALTYRMIKRYYEENPIRDDGTYTFYIAKRLA